MAQNSIRGNISAAAFPLLSELSGRDIVIKQADQNYIAAIQPGTASEERDNNAGVPVLHYCHNVIPTSTGYQSVDYLEVTAAAAVGKQNFVGTLEATEAATGLKAYLGYDAVGNFWYALDPYYTWVSIGNFPTLAGKQVFNAFVNGITYFYFSNVACYKFNFTTYTLDVVTLTGLTAASILGITSVQGYLVAWTKDALSWSSLVDPTDFTPSLVTGAGGGSVQGAEGNIVCCVPHTVGMVVYTAKNAVAAPTSGNARYPFNFRKLVASGGIASRDLITFDANTGNHYAYTTSGLQLVSLQQVQTVFPEVTDFLAGSLFEDFNTNTEVFTVTTLTSVMKKRMKLISDRYLIISYGITELTHAIVYDVGLKRWGKLRFTHVDAFEFSLLQPEIVETPRRSIAFLAKDGSVNVVKIDARNTESDGVMMIGKYQYIRSRMTVLDTVEIENVIPGAPIDITDFYTVRDKTQLKKSGYLLGGDTLSRKYAFNTVGINHSLLIRGGFNLVSIVITTHIHGRR